MKILVADDESHITHMLQFLFEKQGHDVVVVDNGNAAVEQIASERPDVVFLDLNMPGKDGFQVCEELRAQALYRHLPIYILTAQGQDADRAKGLALGATDYITKPFAPSRLVAIIEALRADSGPGQE